MKTIAVFCVLLATTIAGPVEDLDWKPEIEGRIFGGRPAASHQFPYQVGLLLWEESSDGLNYVELCGGSLISNKVVLTAAHCLYEVLDVEVHLGAQSLRLPNKGKIIQNVTNKDFIIHPEFNITTTVNDIALIILPNEVIFNEYVQPINLPRPDQVQTVLEGRVAVVAGWGDIGDSRIASWDNLLYTNVTILPSKPCEKLYPLGFYRTQICVSGDNNKTHCPGDSGGPLVVSDADGIKFVVGVISGGKKDCELGYPTVSTRVTSYLDWIARNAGVVPH